MNATAGSTSDLTLTLANTGTADIACRGDERQRPDAAGRSPSSRRPSPCRPGKQVQVVAHSRRRAAAIAGDYVATFKATAPTATASADIRVTIETSLLWGVIGIGLIVLVLAGLFWTFRRFGRR